MLLELVCCVEVSQIQQGCRIRHSPAFREGND